MDIRIDAGLPELADETYGALCRLMHQACGLHFSPSKKALVASRLLSRIQRLGLAHYDDYVELISSAHDGGEFQMAVDLLTTNETYFFREEAHFEWLEREFGAVDSRRPQVWSAASSFGDEAFSVAMLLADLEAAGRVDAGWSVLGTDISDRVLRSAVQAIYPLERLRHVSPQRLRRHCLRGEGESEGFVQISDRLRRHVRFGRLNLCEPMESLGPFDVVLLRNVLIYFDPATKLQVVDRALSQLRPGGLLLVGTAEGRVPSTSPLQTLAPGVFRFSGDRP